jgi:hypothetical protein
MPRAFKVFAPSESCSLKKGVAGSTNHVDTHEFKTINVGREHNNTKFNFQKTCERRTECCVGLDQETTSILCGTEIW